MAEFECNLRRNLEDCIRIHPAHNRRHQDRWLLQLGGKQTRMR